MACQDFAQKQKVSMFVFLSSSHMRRRKDFLNLKNVYVSLHTPPII